MEEGAAAPLEAVRALPPVAGDLVASDLWRCSQNWEATVRVHEREVLDEPCTVELFGNLSIDEGGILTHASVEEERFQVLRRSDWAKRADVFGDAT